MKRSAMVVVLAIAGLAGAGLWAYRSSGFGESAAQVVALKVTPEFVDVKRGDSDTAMASIELHNTGSRAIHIEKVETSCHCTSVDSMTLMDLAPGQSTTIKLKLQLPNIGKQETSVTLFTDSPAMPKIRIPVKMQGAEIHPPYFLANPQVVRHLITGKDDRRVSFEVSAVESPGEPWMTGFDSTNEHFSVVSCDSTITTVYDETSLHRSYRCVLEATQFIPGETLSGLLRPKCRTESLKPLPIIQATIFSTATANATPSQLFVTRKSRQALPIQKTILIQTAAGTANPVREVTASVNWMTVDQGSGDETHPVFRVTINPPAEWETNVTAQITFQFSDSGIPPLSVPVVFE